MKQALTALSKSSLYLIRSARGRCKKGPPTEGTEASSRRGGPLCGGRAPERFPLIVQWAKYRHSFGRVQALLNHERVPPRSRRFEAGRIFCCSSRHLYLNVLARTALCPLHKLLARRHRILKVFGGVRSHQRSFARDDYIENVLRLSSSVRLPARRLRGTRPGTTSRSD
jgi:hypothetical protein